MLTARRSLATGLLGLAAAACMPAGDAIAQQIFRIVGPDGKVTFSDQPPPNAAASAAPVVRLDANGRTVDPAGLPFELRQTMNRFPVTLYSGDSCAPCESARAMLTSRGVPFTERTITSPEDFEAFKRLGGSTSLPFLTIGGQQLKGYSDVTWSQYLDAAGYPKTSVLPPSYRNAPASPLVAVQTTPATPADSTAAAPPARTAPSTPTAPPPENPAGIRF